MSDCPTPRATEWRDIPGYEGFYQVSANGLVRSLFRRAAPNGTGLPPRTVRERLLKQHFTRGGYLNVFLYRDGVRVTRKVHRLVAEAFLSDSWFEGALACHNDGSRVNNTVGNLRWGTASENMQDKFRHGTNFQANKTHCANGHPYDETNTKVSPGRRDCRTCRREISRRYRLRKKAIA